MSLSAESTYKWIALGSQSRVEIRDKARDGAIETLIVSQIVRSNVTDTSNNQLILSNATASGTNRSLLGFSEFSDAELAGYRLRCGIWITFVVASTFVAAAKFYFGYRVSVQRICTPLFSTIMEFSFSLRCFLFANTSRHKHHFIFVSYSVNNKD